MNFWEFLSENFIWIVMLMVLVLSFYYQHTENMAKIQNGTPKVEQTGK